MVDKKPCAYSAVFKNNHNQSNSRKKRNSHSSVNMAETVSVVSAESVASVRSIKTIKNTQNKLVLHLYSKNWDLALDRLERKPSDILDRHLFLHIALQNKAPHRVITKLGDARTDAFYHKDHSHDMMPLHIACQNGYTLETIQYLYQQYPKAISTPCKEGMLPLHLACASNACRMQVITYLLGNHPDAVEHADSKDMTPILYVQHSAHPNALKIQKEFERDKACWRARDIYNPQGNPLALQICQRQWTQAIQRLQKYPEEATIWTKYKEKRYLPIHYATKYKAPMHVIQELVDIHPFSLALTCQDFDMTPLHLACQRNMSIDVIHVLLEGHEDATSHQDVLGLLPLHLACAAGASVGVVEALLRANPGAAVQKDSKGYSPQVYAEAACHPHSKQVLQVLEDAKQRI